MEGIQLLGAPSRNLKPGLEALLPKHGHQRDGHQQAGESEDVRDPADGVLVAAWHKKEQQGANQRREKNDGENVILHNVSAVET